MSTVYEEGYTIGTVFEEQSSLGDLGTDGFALGTIYDLGNRTIYDEDEEEGTTYE